MLLNLGGKLIEGILRGVERTRVGDKAAEKLWFLLHTRGAEMHFQGSLGSKAKNRTRKSKDLR